METDGDNLEQIYAMQKDWLTNFDKPEHESVFVLWNTDLRAKCRDQVVEQCRKIRADEPFDLTKLQAIDE